MLWLDIRDLHVSYGSRRALQGVSIQVDAGQTASIIGANGAGKSTLLKALMGLIKPSSGRISFKGSRIDGLASTAIVKSGLAISPEGRRLFPELTVRENLMMGAYQRPVAEARKSLEEIHAYFPLLAERGKQLGGSLSGGQQQMVAIGRALMAKPSLLLLDEPSLGLAPKVVAEIAAIIGRISRTGISVILVEQNAAMALAMSDVAYVLQNGVVTVSGTGRELLGNEHVQRSYLGM